MSPRPGRHTWLMLGLLLCAVAVTSCVVSRHPAGIASSTAPLRSSYTNLGAASDTSCHYWVLILPLGAKDSTDEMIDRLVKARGGDALVGVTVEYTTSTFALPFFWSNCTVVQGSVVKGTE